MSDVFRLSLSKKRYIFFLKKKKEFKTKRKKIEKEKKFKGNIYIEG
jgi:uncharacterized protein YdeI (YjbR/CyaY-like superfamily)